MSNGINKIKFIKADLDTVASAALILEKLPDKIYVLKNIAGEKSLNDSACLCLECGGDGLCSLNNFDHHLKSELPCAAVQAFNEYKCSEKYLNLANYVEYIDTGRGGFKSASFDNNCCSISGLFSGMLSLYKNEKTRFKKGFELLKRIMSMSEAIDNPLAVPVDNSLFLKYLQAKKHITEALYHEKNKVVKVDCAVPTMYLKTQYMGVHGLLHKLGAVISIAVNAGTGKISISSVPGYEYLVEAFEKELNQQEEKNNADHKASDSGNRWGGHASMGIIGCPRNGSSLEFNQIIDIICKVTHNVINQKPLNIQS